VTIPLAESRFVDTNIILRYLTNDVPEQADAVERLLERAHYGEISLVVPLLVAAELVWTLESFYELARPAIRDAILGILNTPGLEIEESDRVLQAVIWYAEKNVDFIDAYHAAWMLDQGIEIAHTFDESHFRRFEHITVEVPG
jgi:predicted nucleic-acid-binding protein